MFHSIDIIRRIINRKILLYSIFWISILTMVFFSENWEHRENYRETFFLQYAIVFGIAIINSYINVNVLIPRYFKKREYVLFTIYLLIILIVGAILALVLQIFSNYLGLYNPHNLKSDEHDMLSYFFHVFFSEIMIIVASTMFFIMDEWIKFQDVTIKLKETESQKVQSELQALKSQINPHFLFNTLNNIYSHSLENSPKTPEMILKLSDLMSYILYECHDDKVPVNNELNFIRNYIELEKLRFEDGLNVELEINEHNTDTQIEPLLFIAFIENAFKHQGSYEKDKPYVHIGITIERNSITLKVLNSKGMNNIRMSDKEGGFGIENVKKRLELLYPDQHLLKIDEGENEYQVELKIRI